MIFFFLDTFSKLTWFLSSSYDLSSNYFYISPLIFKENNFRVVGFSF